MTAVLSLLIGLVAGWLLGRGYIDNAIVVGMIGFAIVVLEPLIFPSEPS